ncbi:neutral zinc metallopeptidase [Amycolatopsis sp. NPDC059657]|uniref:neutral zinc metallopeptidase n=1 Tax=Amycolatopsis sp. NPDC059657 TaxID=3346899 RepID=UPI00366C0815
MKALTRAACAAALVAVLGGCAQAVPGTSAPDRQDPTKVAGLAITDGPSGPKAGVADAGLPVLNGDGGAIDKLAANAVADVQQYWKEQLPEHFDRQFKPISRLVSYDSGARGLNLCGSSTAGLVNAFYCANDDTVAWDRGELLPSLDESFGPMSVVAVLAHELGHAIQFRLGDGDAPSIVKEQQADCYAGNFFRWVAGGNAPHFQLSTGPGLNQIMSTLFFIRDNAGTSAAAEGAHGDAFDRVSAFQFGFGEDPKRCAKIDVTEVRQRISQQAFSPEERDSGLGKGNLRVTDPNALKNLEDSLRIAFPGTQPPSFTQRTATCVNAKLTTPAAYCPATNVVTLNPAELTKIGTPPRRGNKGGIGDFAAFAEIASRYALAAQKTSGGSLDGPVAGLRTACLTGTWASTMRGDQETPLKLSPGDLDEAVAEMLKANSLIAGDLDGKSVGSGFARVEAFRDGFASGSAICTSKYA